MTLKRKKISIRECLADPKERRQMLCGAVRFIQAVEGRDISMEQAEEAYDKISGSKERWKMDRAAIRNPLRRLAIELPRDKSPEAFEEEVRAIMGSILLEELEHRGYNG